VDHAQRIDVPAAPADTFVLDPSVVHLNHGSYGACPRAVLDQQARLRARVEAATMRYFVCEWQGDLDRARAAVASFVGADPEGLVFTPNTTTGVSTVLASIAPELRPGDELLATDHTYRACRNALDRTAARTGAKVVVAPLPWPARDPGDVTAALTAAATPRTKLALVDHITSATALVCDAREVVRELAARGIDTLVDGAHAPGQVELDVGAIGAAYYVANGHKWLCGPKGAAFLHVRADLRARVHPLVVSHGFSAEYGPPNRFHAEHDWTGTHDPTAYLALPAAIDHVASLVPGGWAAIRARNHALAVAGRELLADRLGAGVLAPASMLGAMACVPVTLPTGTAAIAVERALLDQGWEVPVIPGPRGIAMVRISAHLYNHVEQVLGLAIALSALGVRGATP
jgi:isopenicillin-N epimerase